MCEIRVVIAGPKKFSYDKLKENCDRIIGQAVRDSHNDNVRIVCDTSKGINLLGEYYAKENGYVISQIKNEMKFMSKNAAVERNRKIMEYASANDNEGILIAFQDRNNRDIENLVDCAKECGVHIHLLCRDDTGWEEHAMQVPASAN